MTKDTKVTALSALKSMNVSLVIITVARMLNVSTLMALLFVFVGSVITVTVFSATISMSALRVLTFVTGKMEFVPILTEAINVLVRLVTREMVKNAKMLMNASSTRATVYQIPNASIIKAVLHVNA